jgi:ureidoglycolate lyase
MLTSLPISANGLAPFATLLASDGSPRIDFPAAAERGQEAVQPSLCVLRVAPVPASGLSFARMERHPHTAQAFMPLTVGRWIVVVAPDAAGVPDAGRARAFLAGPGDAIVYHRNAWHAAITVFDRPADIAMMMWKTASGEDTVLADLPAPLKVALPG